MTGAPQGLATLRGVNVVQADQVGCHIITVTSDILNKLRQLGRGLDDVSLDTVRMFHDDAKKA